MIPLIAAVSVLAGFIAGFAFRSIAAKNALEALKKEKSPFVVEVRPYSEEYRDDGWFKDEHEFRVGCQYQLLVYGIPCFEPHVRIEKSWKESKIDPKKAKEALQLAVEAAESALTLKVGAAAGLFKMGSALVHSTNGKRA